MTHKFKNIKDLLKGMPEGIVRGNPGYICNFCNVHNLNTERARKHNCAVTLERFNKRATDPGEINKAFYRQIIGKNY